jgi:hypothetical protein
LEASVNAAARSSPTLSGMTTTPDSPRLPGALETWQNLLGGTAAIIRFAEETDPAKFGVTDSQAWETALEQIDAAGPFLPEEGALLQIETGSRGLMSLVAADPHQLIVQRTLGPVEISLAAAMDLVKGALAELDAARSASGEGE